MKTSIYTALHSQRKDNWQRSLSNYINRSVGTYAHSEAYWKVDGIVWRLTQTLLCTAVANFTLHKVKYEINDPR